MCFVTRPCPRLSDSQSRQLAGPAGGGGGGGGSGARAAGLGQGHRGTQAPGTGPRIAHCPRCLWRRAAQLPPNLTRAGGPQMKPTPRQKTKKRRQAHEPPRTGGTEGLQSPHLLRTHKASARLRSPQLPKEHFALGPQPLLSALGALGLALGANQASLSQPSGQGSSAEGGGVQTKVPA